jgi:uncharacterized membrane protein
MNRLGHWLYCGLIVVILAGLVHLVALLMIPAMAERDAFARVEALGAPFKTIALPTPSPKSRLIPHADPAVAAAVCRYDLSGGPVRARAPLSRPGFAALSFHSRRGAIFYALTDGAAAKGRMDALIVTAEQLRVLESHDDEDNPTEDLRIVSPTPQGFVMMRALSQSPDDMASVEEEAAAMTCAPEPIAEAEK